MSDLFLSTLPVNQQAPVAKPPMPTTPGDLYLLGLLAMQSGLELGPRRRIIHGLHSDERKANSFGNHVRQHRPRRRCLSVPSG